MIRLLMAATLLCSTEVFRMEHDTETDNLYVVGVDGVRRQCCIVEPEQYALLTGRVDAVWKSLNATESGRKGLHGGIPKKEIVGTEKVSRYPDGYIYHESMRPRTNTVRRATATATAPRVLHSARRLELERLLSARQTNAVKTVTVIHDGATGKDSVK